MPREFPDHEGQAAGSAWIATVAQPAFEEFATFAGVFGVKAKVSCSPRRCWIEIRPRREGGAAFRAWVGALGSDCEKLDVGIPGFSVDLGRARPNAVDAAAIRNLLRKSLSRWLSLEQ